MPLPATATLRKTRFTGKEPSTVAGVHDQIGGAPAVSAAVGLAIGGGTFDRVVGHPVATLTGLGVPDQMIDAIGAKLAPMRVQIVMA